MRPSALPKLVVAQPSYKMPSDIYSDFMDSPYSATSNHSRDSSGASDDYSPLTQTFSFQEQNRFSDSSSSLATTPPKFCQSLDSPRTSRTTLGDLVEVPDEREDDFDFCDLSLTTSQCLCASPFCSRQCSFASALERPSLDYSLADGFNSDGEAPLSISKVRQSAGNSPVGNLATRIGSRLPSLSRRMREKGSSTPAIRQRNVRSAPASRVLSRTSSYRVPSIPNSLVGHIDGRDTPTTIALTTQIETIADEQPHERAPSVDIPVRSPLSEEPIDRKALASTPLLPTPLVEKRGSDHGSIQSPLQSPTVADSPVFSYSISPSSTPVMSTALSPPLSSKPSFASFGGLQSSQVLSPDHPYAETAPVEDKWAASLGHANFVVHPSPYIPEKCTSNSCKRLVQDWEDARKQFMNQASRTSEHYGPTSHIYKMTEQKWAEIDALWRKNHETAVEHAKKFERGVREHTQDLRRPEREYQPLAEPLPLTKLPSLNDPDNIGKFPKLDEGPVGPMVQYAQLTTQASKRTAFLKFFRDLRSPGNTLGRSATGIHR